MNTLLVGNSLSMIGCLIMVAVGFLKRKSHILIAQSVQCLFMGAGNLILGGISGFVCNIVTVGRNLAFIRFRNTTSLKVFFIVLQFVLSIGSLSAGWISWLPIVAVAIFTWFMDTTSEIRLKFIIMGTMLMWLVYDLYFRNYVAATFDVMTIVSNCIGLYTICKQK